MAGRYVHKVGNIQSAWRHASEMYLKVGASPPAFWKGGTMEVLKAALVLDQVDNWGLGLMDFITDKVKGQSRSHTQSLTPGCRFP